MPRQAREAASPYGHRRRQPGGVFHGKRCSKGIANTLSTFLLLSMVMLMMQATIAMDGPAKRAYMANAEAARAGAAADDMNFAAKSAYCEAGFNVSADPKLFQYREAYPAALANLSFNLGVLAAQFNSSGADVANLSFGAAASAPEFYARPINATARYAGNVTSVTPINANWSSGKVIGYNISIATGCGSFVHDILNFSNSSSDKLRLRIDLFCTSIPGFTMVYYVDKYNSTAIRFREGNITMAQIQVSSPAKVEVLKLRQMNLNITMEIADASPRAEAAGSFVAAAGNASRAGAVVLE